MEQMSIIRINNSCLLYIQKSLLWLLLSQLTKKKKNHISLHSVAGLHKRLVLCTRRQTCRFWGLGLAMVMTKMDSLCSKEGCCSENDFSFKKKKKKQNYKRRRCMLASTVVSCDGVLCVKEVGASVQQGRLYKPLADFILIYELLFPMTYSIFISYIYLFWEYIFAGMRLNKKNSERDRGFSSFTVLTCKC